MCSRVRNVNSFDKNDGLFVKVKSVIHSLWSLNKWLLWKICYTCHPRIPNTYFCIRSTSGAFSGMGNSRPWLFLFGIICLFVYRFVQTQIISWEQQIKEYTVIHINSYILLILEFYGTFLNINSESTKIHHQNFIS